MDSVEHEFDANDTVAVIDNNVTAFNMRSIYNNSNNDNILDYSVVITTNQGELSSVVSSSSNSRYNNGDIIETHWNLLFVCFSWITSFVSAYAVVRLLDHITWRTDKQKANATKTPFIIQHSKIISSSIFGYGAIWAMHFIGVSAVTPLHVPSCPNWPLAIGVSLSCAVLFVQIGFFIVQRYDCFAGPDRLEFLKSILYQDRRVTDKQYRKRARSVIHLTAFFHQPQFVIAGGMMAAVGALLMHYTGTSATSGPFTIEYRTDIVCLNIFVAVVICIVGFFIIFRILHWKVEEFWLRPVSAAVIATAVNSLHYIGQYGMLFIFNSDIDHKCTTNEVGMWTTLQTTVVFVCLSAPCIACYVEHAINQDLMFAYVELKNPTLNLTNSIDYAKSSNATANSRKKTKSDKYSLDNEESITSRNEVKNKETSKFSPDFGSRTSFRNESVVNCIMEELSECEEQEVGEE